MPSEKIYVEQQNVQKFNEAKSSVDGNTLISKEEDGLHCLRTEQINPFNGSGGCTPGVPSKEVAAMDRSSNEEDLLKGYTSRMAIAVLTMAPNAPIEAYTVYEKCRSMHELTPDEYTECSEITKVMPFVRLGLSRSANSGDKKAALLMAKNYLSLLPGAEKEYRPEFIKKLHKYLSIVNDAFPEEVNEINTNLQYYQ